MLEQINNLRYLDGLRGLAALYVVIGHARWLLWEGMSAFQQHPECYSRLQKLLVYFLAIFRYGHEAVLFFFVLSGFVIHLRYARLLEKEKNNARFDWLHFVWRRAHRLYPPLMAALALSWALYLLGTRLEYPIYQAATGYPLINQNVVCSVSEQTLLGNLAFLMNTYVPVFGGDGPLWSLKYEWWFYMIYPLFWLLTKRSLAGATFLMVLLFFLAQAGQWPVRLLQDIFGSMLTWWLGVLLADVYVGRLKMPWAVVAGASLTGMAATHFFPQVHDLGMALGFSGLLAVGFLLQKKHISLAPLEWIKPLGDMSYTLFVAHFPILVFVSGWLMSRSPQNTLPQHFGWFFGGVLLAVLFSYVLHLVAERPFLNRRHTGS